SSLTVRVPAWEHRTRMRTERARLATATLVAALCAAAPARAATFLFLNSDAEYVDGGKQQLFTPLDGVFTASSFGTTVDISFDGGAAHYWSLDFAAPFDAPLQPGAYEMAERYPFQSPTRPGLSVTGEGRGCNVLSGRFVVLDVVYGPGGEPESFAADFEQHCEDGPHALVGSIRYHTGDLGCAGMADGVPCDDRDACTAGSTCQAEACVGAGATACAVEDDGCHQSGLCDPASGACAVARSADGAACP